MEEKNKKIIFSLFLGCIAIETIFLLAFGANFLFAMIDDGPLKDDKLTIKFVSIAPLITIYGDNTISAATNIEPDSVAFSVNGPQYLEFSGAMDSATSYHFIWDTASFPNGYYNVEAIARKGIDEARTSFSVEVSNNDIAIESVEPTAEPIPTEPEPVSEPVSEPEEPTIEPEPVSEPMSESNPAEPISTEHINYIPAECKERNLLTPEECQKYMSIPFECKEQNILNSKECDKYMMENFMPSECEESGILNPKACKKYIFEKYGGGENIPVEKFPIECKKVDAKTIEECKKVMQKTYMPEECANEGLENGQECETYLQQKHMPEECLDVDAKSRQECDEIMFEKFGSPECKTASIDDKKECEEFMFNKYALKASCDNIEDWQCKSSIKERHLGSIVSKQTAYNKINEKKEEITGKSMKAEDPRMEIVQGKKMFPIVKKNIGIKIIETNQTIVLDKEENLIQTAPIAFMIDSDEDGLPDDMEKRFGTNPFKADTDEDGYTDEEEIKNGFNPLGEGKFEKKLAPIEKAVMEDTPLGHPIIEGEEMENFFVKSISNMEDEQGNSVEGYIFSGKTKPNSVATLYIYSDLPVVVTVDADQYGNWSYQLDQSLIEGEHEVYVAINDDTGKVIEKSKPLNFFIKEASAVSVKDFVSTTKATSEEPKESGVSIYYYLLFTLFMTIAGIFLFLAVIISTKKKQPL